jgi:hypothetical protein
MKIRQPAVTGAAFGVGLTLLLLPTVAAAQEGTIHYDRARRYEFEIPETVPEELKAEIGTQEVTPMVMYFTAAEWVLRPVPVEAPPLVVSDRVPEAQRTLILTTRLRMSSVTRGSREKLLETYVGGGAVVETREFLDRTFLLSGPLPSFAWSLTAEEGEFLGHRVQKAVATQDDATVEAWFTPEIPVPAGPATYGGLPGLILVVNVNDGELIYTATEVSREPLLEGVIEAPEEGDRVTREEYEEIVAEKLEELRTTRGRGGGD